MSELGDNCLKCGRCCHFSSYDHQLWVTQLELQYLAGEHGVRKPISTEACPYMQDQQCTARQGRALGCRIFYCEGDRAHGEQLYEKYLNRIRRLAEELGLELYYGEFLETLTEARFADEDS